MEVKDDIRFYFNHSPLGVISGIAIGEEGDIIASYKLETEQDTFYLHGRPCQSVVLTVVCKEHGVKVYNIFEKILSKYSADDQKFQTGSPGGIRCRWRICNDRVERAFEEISETLENSFLGAFRA
ncbi:MAG: hypothetical protein ACOC6G_01005 [Thermoproteota archaeon]